MDAARRRPPLSRGDSAVSARDSRYWLALASASSSASARSLASAGSAGDSLSLWELRGQAIPPTASRPDGAPRSADLAALADALAVPTRHAVPRSQRSASDAWADAEFPERRLTRSMPVARRRQTRPRPAIVAEVVLEHQRHQHVLGWGAKGHLLPLDPSKFARATRKPSAPRPGGDGDGGADGRRRSLGELPFRSRSANAEEDPQRERCATDLEKLDAPVKWVHSATFPDVTLPDVAVPAEEKKKKQLRQRAIDEREARAKKAAALRRLSSTSRWEWISPWHLEYPTQFPAHQPRDPDGWEYTTSFQNFSTPAKVSELSTQLRQRQHRHRDEDDDEAEASSPPQYVAVMPVNPLVFSCWQPKCNVRRRKWVRFRRLRSGRSISEVRLSHTSAFDDSFLDSMSGWLKKLGHVRKNWKARYFVLERSILRYYSDESRSRLKGEVLLFHPATRVHYVDIHLAGGRDNSFAIQVGAEYTLLLQAERLSDRENWMYCIEDALLCRDSYFHDPDVACDLRESVAQRRLLSSEALAFDLQEQRPTMANGGARGRSTSDLVNLVASLHSKSDGLLRAASKSPKLLRLLRLCDYFLESDEMKHHISEFIARFKHKYSNNSRPVSPIANTPPMRNSDPLFGGLGMPNTPRHSSLEEFPAELLNVTVLQDARSLLALKNYRFFLERSLERIVEYLSDQSFAETAKLTSPRGGHRPSTVSKRQPGAIGGTEKSGPGPTDDEWQMARRAALFKLERFTFIPLQETIYRLLESTVAESDMEQFERNRQYLSTQLPGFFEIPKVLTSSSGWKSATLLLNTMDNYSLPTEKASVLVEVAHCIFDTQVREHGDSEETVNAMSADDFLPIFIFVLTRSRLRSIVISRHLISETMITAMMIGETGYYATMLEAAIGYIASFDLDEAVASGANRDSAAGRVSTSSVANTASLSE